MYLQQLVDRLDVVQRGEDLRRGSVDAEVGQGQIEVLVVVAVDPGREVGRADGDANVVYAGGVCAVSCCGLGMNLMSGWCVCVVLQ